MCRCEGLLRAVVLSMAVLLSGCITFKYLPEGGQAIQAVPVPAEISTMPGAVASVRVASSEPSFSAPANSTARGDLSQWFSSPGQEMTIYFTTANDTSKGIAKNGRTGVWTIIPSIASAMIIPFVANDHFISTMEIRVAGQTVFRHQQPYLVRTSGSLLPLAKLLGESGDVVGPETVRDILARHKLMLEKHLAESRSDWDVAERSGTTQAYREFVRQHPDSLLATVALKRLAAKAPARNPLAFHIENSRLHRAYLAFIPEDQAIWFLGPEGLRVHDILTESRRQDATLLAARIRSAGGTYKAFDGDEIERLQSSGIKPELVAAMLDVTTAPSRPASPTGAVQTLQPAAAAAAGAAEENGVADVAAECAKRYAALKACDQVPFPGGTVCRAAANNKYSHLACSVIQ